MYRCLECGKFISDKKGEIIGYKGKNVTIIKCKSGHENYFSNDKIDENFVKRV